MSAHKGLAKDAIASMARHAATVIAGFVTIPILTRMLGAARLGFWSLLGTAAFLMGLADLGLNTATLRASAGTDPHYAKQVAKLASLLTALISLPVMALVAWWLFGAAERLPVEQQADARRAVVIAIVAGSVAASAHGARSYAQGQGKIVALAWARAAAVFLQLAVTLTLLFLGWQLTAVAIGFASGVFVEAVLGFRAAADGVSWKGIPSGENRKEMIRVAGSAMLTNISVILAVRADVLVLERITNLATIGAYSVASRLVDQGYTLVKQVSAALVPRLGKRAGQEGSREDSIRLGTMLVGVMATGPLAVAAISGRPILVLWAGDAVDLPILGVALAWLAFASMIASASEIVTSAMSLGGDAVAAAKYIAAGSFTNITLSIAGGYAFGAWAVAASTFAGNTVLAFLVWRWTKKHLDWSLGEIAKVFVPIFLALGVGLATGFGGNALGIHGLITTAVGAIISVGVGFGAIWLSFRHAAGSQQQEARS